jgi:toxin YoeB
MRRRILFEAEAFEDYNAWAKWIAKFITKWEKLLKILAIAFLGIGKPEPLKYMDLVDFGPRRISDEHRRPSIKLVIQEF